MALCSEKYCFRTAFHTYQKSNTGPKSLRQKGKGNQSKWEGLFPWYWVAIFYKGMNIEFLIELSCTVNYLVQKKMGNFKITESIIVISADLMSGLEESRF